MTFFYFFSYNFFKKFEFELISFQLLSLRTKLSDLFVKSITFNLGRFT